MHSSHSKQIQATITYCRKDLVPPLPPVIFGRLSNGPANPPIQTPKQDYLVLITDVAGHEGNFSLQTQSIEFVRRESILKDHDFDDEELVRRASLLPSISSNTSAGTAQTFSTGPVHGVHVDQHPAAAEGFARRWLGEDKADELLRTHARWQIIKVWRPIREVQRDPLAVADARSVPDEDILKVRLVYPDHEIDILEVKAPLDLEGQRLHDWYFKDRMGPGDVLLFTQFDSTERAGVPKRVPHTAFKDTRVDEGTAEARKSVEVRVVVFYDSDWNP